MSSELPEFSEEGLVVAGTFGKSLNPYLGSESIWSGDGLPKRLTRLFSRSAVLHAKFKGPLRLYVLLG